MAASYLAAGASFFREPDWGAHAALALDLHFFEDATFYDKLQNARQEASWRSLEMVDTCFSLAQNVITLLSLLAILLTFSPLLAMLLLFATLPAFIARIRNSNEFYGFRIATRPSHAVCATWSTC